MGEDNDEFYSSKFFRTLVVAALFSGAGSGAINLNKDTSDRFKGADFTRQIATRDAAILENKREIQRIEDQRDRHREHSATYTQIISQLKRDYENHMRKHHEP